jgi:hypothetical protein
MTLKTLPPLLQSLLLLKNSLQDKEQFSSHLNHFEKQVRNGQFRRRIVVLLVTDLTMLICFGALFPPLAVIIALSVLKDVFSIRLALGRYCEIMTAVQDENLKEHMVKMKESMDEEMLNAGAGIWNGVWYGIIMGTWIWGFVLFDTMASVEGIGKGLWVLIWMTVGPFLINYLSQVNMKLRNLNDSEAGKDRKMDYPTNDFDHHNGEDAHKKIGVLPAVTNNPILYRDSHIEMVSGTSITETISGECSDLVE